MSLDRRPDKPAADPRPQPATGAHKEADGTLSGITPLPPPLPLASQSPTPPAAPLPSEFRAAPGPQSNAARPLEPTPEPLPPPAPRQQKPAVPRPPPPAAFVVELPPADDLSFFDAPRVLGWAVATGFSGCLWLAPLAPFAPPLNALSDDSTPHRELYLENGGLIGAFSTLPGDSLVDYLLPIWSRQQAQRARSVVAALPPAQPREQLAVLIQAGLLKRASATAHLASYVNALCCRALAPGSGRYRVLPRALTNNERIEPPLPLRRLLVEGLRKGASLEFLHLRLGPPVTCLRPTAVIGATEGGAALLDVGLSPAEEMALACFNGRYSLADITQRTQLGEHAVYVLGYALLCLGAAAAPRLTPRPMPRPKPGAAPGASAHSPTASPASSASNQSGPQRAVTDDTESAIRRVQQKFRQVEEGDYFSLLELKKGASTAEVLAAHKALRAEFTPTALPYRCRSSMDRELRQIARALDEARVVLGSDVNRRIYADKLLPTA